MIRPRPLYFLRRAMVNLRGAPLPAFVTAATIAVSIFLFGAFLLTGENGARAIVGWAGEGDALVAYTTRGMPSASVEALGRKIGALPAVAAARVITPEQGFEDLRRALGDQAPVLEGVEPREVLPAAITVKLHASSLAPEAVDAVARQIRGFAGVEALDSETAWVARFARLGSMLWWVGLGWAAILGFGSLLVIGNSTRLAALTRKDEIEVLRLVGASEAFVVIPFFLEGAIQGLAGSAVGVGALFAAYSALEQALRGDSWVAALTDLRFLSPAALAGLAGAGPVLGAIGAAGSARRFLQGLAL